MPMEVTSYFKSDLDKELAAIDAIESSDVPTILVQGISRPVNVTNYKRKLRKQALRVHGENLVSEAITPLIAAGYPDAYGMMKFGKLVITLQTPTDEEIL